ncbi:MAG TPA: glutamate--tRNA ligase [Dehalococcoidia bacterium]|nr:glutamate--tRNA ligase [Dehalococcoidia bacterium]
MSEESVRVRYAPSPTGYPHIGNIRTALFNWLFARHTCGRFILRIEDTDIARRVKGSEDAILNSLRWLGLDWDEGPEVGGDYGPYIQSERRDLYQKCAQQLLEGGHAYKCYCTAERLSSMRAEMAERKESMRSYDRHCRDLSLEERARLESGGISPVIRFKVPLMGQTTFHDLIRGDITFDNSELDDLVLLKSDGYPTYHLANIVDDHFMKITHVMRADEWLSSTPRHFLLYRAFEWEPPLFAHLPMILGVDKSKLSKRHGAVSLIEYSEMGYLPEAMTNFLALLGWALDDRSELFSREELISHFSIERISKTAAIFNKDKLDWMNGVYIRNMSIAELTEQLLTFLVRGLPGEVKQPISWEYVQQIVPLIRERATTLKGAAELYKSIFKPATQIISPKTIPSDVKLGTLTVYLEKELDYDAKLLYGKNLTKEAVVAALEAALQRLTELDTDWDGTGRDAEKLAEDAASLEAVLRTLASELGLKTGELFGLLRVAVTGRTAAPPLFQTMAVLGRERCLRRIEAALSKLSVV